jgi:transcriptional regulator with XRE-family HTH domain
VKNRPRRSDNLVRILRRRLGLSQKELAFLLGYTSESQVSRLENGSRIPQFEQSLAIELLFGTERRSVFPKAHLAVGLELKGRVTELVAQLSQRRSSGSKVSYKTVQLERVMALLERLESAALPDAKRERKKRSAPREGDRSLD